MNQVVNLIPGRLQEVTIQQALKAYLLDCQARNLSPRTVLWYEEKINAFMKFLSASAAAPAAGCPLSLLHEGTIRLFIQHEKEKENRQAKGKPLSSATIKGTVIAIKAFCKFLFTEGYLKENMAAKIKAPKIQKKIIEAFSTEHIKALLDVPDKKDFTGYRDYCILLTFLDTGIRLSELVNLQLSCIDFSANTLFVLGKGNKERRVPFGNGVTEGS